MSKSLIASSQEFIGKLEMLNKLMQEEWTDAAEQEAFAQEIVQSIVGDETTMVSKVGNIQAFMDRIDADVERARVWKKDIDRQIGVAGNVQARIKDYALMVLKAIEGKTGKKGIESDGVKITYQAQGPKERFEIVDEALIPFKYFEHEIHVKVTNEQLDGMLKAIASTGIQPYSITKMLVTDEIKKAIAAGEQVSGVKQLPQSEGIRIKNVLPKGEKE